MDPEKLKEWLDAAVKRFKDSDTVRRFDDDIYELSGYTSGVHISGVRKIAEALNIPVEEEPWSTDTSVATEISCNYKGVRFFELENMRDVNPEEVSE